MRGGGQKGAEARFLAAAFGMLALLVQAFVPQGFMVAREGDRPAIVICTGHGPLLGSDDLRGYPAKAPEHKSSMVCDFAGHGAGLASAAPPVLAVPTLWSHPDTDTPSLKVAPGRGLAAPPPPSQAPPLTLS